MSFKYYDSLSMLISGTVLLLIISHAIDWDIAKFNTVVVLAIAYVTGYLLNAVSAFMEPVYYWFMGGKPSSQLLKSPKSRLCGKKRQYTGLGRIRFYEYEKVVKLLKNELNDNHANEVKMFGKAMSYSNANEKTRVPDFNAQYAFSRVMLTLVIVSAGVIIPKYYELWWVWIIAIAAILLVGRRCKEIGYYYAREVLIEYLKAKQQ
ncbi:hypothetical protein [uncultured Prevotella sp.]|uniref:hypothetical protein n=1 Tax=uncultured Prevotella sp. TaxID=159272 RepID=UPI00258451E2|nr:hypothetical protein [uncultured Prevotella sp.]